MRIEKVNIEQDGEILRIRYGEHLIGRDFILKKGTYELKCTENEVKLTDSILESTPVERIDNIVGDIEISMNGDLVAVLEEPGSGMSLFVEEFKGGHGFLLHIGSKRDRNDFNKIIDINKPLIKR